MGRRRIPASPATRVATVEVPADSARRRARTKRRNLIIVGCALGVLLVGATIGGVAVRPGSGPAADRSAKPGAAASGNRPDDVAAGGGRVRTFLPRLREVSGLAAFTAECRDNWYRRNGSAVDVTVGFKGPGVVAVGVYPMPGDGADQQTQVHPMGPKESEHTFAFRYVPGQIHHVRVSVTTKTGADQCYARKR